MTLQEIAFHIIIGCIIIALILLVLSLSIPPELQEYMNLANTTCNSYCGTQKIGNIKSEYLGLESENYIGFFEKRHCSLYCVCFNNASTGLLHKNMCDL